MNYAKTRDVKSPTRGTEYSAGVDFYVPEYSKEFKEVLKRKNPTGLRLENELILIEPHMHILIPSGIKMNMETSFFFSALNNNKQFGTVLAFIAHNKSSVGIRQLDVTASVIDQDYQGEMHLSITNTSDKAVAIKYGQKLVQFLLTTVLVEPWIEEKEDVLFSEVSDRCGGGFGSTGSN